MDTLKTYLDVKTDVSILERAQYTGRYRDSFGYMFYCIEGKWVNKLKYLEYLKAQDILNSTPVTLTF